jgi:5-formyltetrahydrofolate cyclo-ligase
MFGGVSTEPDLVPLISWLAERRVRTAFFAISGEVMSPRLVRDEAHLQPGQLNVSEPDRALCEELEASDLDVMLIPGLAFSPVTGARLGRGKGHYDRVLETLPSGRLCVGVCFSLQLCDEVPLEPHDRHVHALVTEEGWLEIQKPPE